MRVTLVMPYYDPAIPDLDATLARYGLTTGLPPALAARGLQVTQIIHAAWDARRAIDGVEYVWVRPSAPARAFGAALHRLRGSFNRSYWEPNRRLARSVRASNPDVVHFAGLTVDLQLALVARETRRLGVPLVVHYHGGLPSTGGRIRRIQRHNLRSVERVLFTSAQQARPWIEAGLLSGPERAVELIETSTNLRGIPLGDARARTGMHGDPVCLSAGRLHPIKDPLTTLRSFARIAAARPQARLYLYYLTGELRPEMDAFIRTVPGLAERVEFRGRAAPEEMAAIYSSSDVLLQASRREWSGLAVLEAMACGCIPVLTRIPAFESMTAGGRYGRLFPPGDDAALADAVMNLDAQTREQLSAETIDYFERELSFAAMARKLEAVFREVRGR